MRAKVLGSEKAKRQSKKIHHYLSEQSRRIMLEEQRMVPSHRGTPRCDAVPIRMRCLASHRFSPAENQPPTKLPGRRRRAMEMRGKRKEEEQRYARHWAQQALSIIISSPASASAAACALSRCSAVAGRRFSQMPSCRQEKAEKGRAFLGVVLPHSTVHTCMLAQSSGRWLTTLTPSHAQGQPRSISKPSKAEAHGSTGTYNRVLPVTVSTEY